MRLQWGMDVRKTLPWGHSSEMFDVIEAADIIRFPAVVR
jgi:hypothetical protein